jgi:dephospho-CoA kinase
MLRIGLTGGIGAGKSAVAHRLAEHGAIVVDSDRIAREVVEPGTPGLAAVVAEFGAEVLRADGSLDRDRLGALVFGDDAARSRLNAIVHPLVGRRAAELAAAAPEGAVLVHDIPLLVENNLAAGFDLVLVVEAPVELRVARLVRDRDMTEEAARARIAAQASDAERRAVADVLLHNDGTLAELREQVDKVCTEIEARRAAG